MDELTQSQIENIFSYVMTKFESISYQRETKGAFNIISFVPEEIRRWKVEAYTPEVVSIGPLHKGTRNNLLFMEEVKWRCMYYFISRNRIEKEELLSHWIKDMFFWAAEGQIRLFYNVVEIKFNRQELAMIMLLDYCFLLELIISGSPGLNEKSKSNLNYTSPGVRLIKMGKVLSDLTLLENQIPFHPIWDIYRRFYSPFTSIDKEFFIKCVLSMLGYRTSSSSSFSISSISEVQGSHFLQLVHSFIDKEKCEHVGEENNHVGISVGSVAQVNISHGENRLHRCATRLQAAGVAVEHSQGTENRFDLKVKFSSGKLVIPQLHITETMETNWRNFIAYEVTTILAQPNEGRALSEQTGDDDTRINCQFICYAWFFQSLICCVHDVKLLRERQVIVVHEEHRKGRKNAMSDEGLMNLFHKLTQGVSECDAEIDMDPWIDDVIQRLNSYTDPRVKRVTETGKIMWHVFRRLLSMIWYRSRDSIRVLIHDYIPTGWRLVAVLAAAAGLALTATQTVFSAPRDPPGH